MLRCLSSIPVTVARRGRALFVVSMWQYIKYSNWIFNCYCFSNLKQIFWITARKNKNYSDVIAHNNGVNNNIVDCSVKDIKLIKLQKTINTHDDNCKKLMYTYSITSIHIKNTKQMNETLRKSVK